MPKIGLSEMISMNKILYYSNQATKWTNFISYSRFCLSMIAIMKWIMIVIRSFLNYHKILIVSRFILVKAQVNQKKMAQDKIFEKSN